MTEFLRELNRIRDEKVPEDELEAARHSVIARFALSLESPQQLSGTRSRERTYNFPADYGTISRADCGPLKRRMFERVREEEYINPGTMQWWLSATPTK